MDDEMVDKILDDIVAEVGPKAIEEMTKDDLAHMNESVFDFSKEHEENMQKLFDEVRRKATDPREDKNTVRSFSHMRTSKKILILAATLVLLFVLLISSVGAWRESFVKYFLNIKEEYSDIKTNNKYVNSNSKDFWVGDIHFGYLPEGYELKTEKEVLNKNIIVFINEKGKTINVEIGEQSFIRTINTEGGKVEEVVIKGKDMIYSENSIQKLLTWSEKDVVVYIYTNDTKDVLWKVAENMQIEESTSIE